MNWTYLVLIGGFIVAPIIAALCWDKCSYLRPLSVLYGLCCGFILSVFVWREMAIWKIIQNVLTFGAVGAGLSFSVWIQLRRK